MKVDAIVLFQLLSVLLFCVGLYTLATRRNGIWMLIGLELMLNASNVLLLSMRPSAESSLAAAFILLVAACETGVVIALLLLAFKHYKTANLDEINSIKE